MANPPRRWRFSYKWMTKHLNCTVEGITSQGGCGGCCVSEGYWPPKSGGEEYGYMCPMLGDNGCSYSVEQRPVICLLYPLTVSPKGVVGMHIQSTRPNSNCAPCYKNGPMLIDVMEATLRNLIGDDNYTRVRAGVLASQDVEVEVPYLTILQLAKEWAWAQHNMVPGPRDGGKPPVVVRTKPVILPWRTLRDHNRGGGNFAPHHNLLDVHVRHRSTPDAPDINVGAQPEQESLPL